MFLATKRKNQLGLFSLVMIAIVSVDSLRNLPIGAQYGFSLITFYMLAALTFFLPLTWVTAKLTAQHPNTGGSYVWIDKAFGPYMGYLSIWLQWVYNIIWYPTIFAFINATLASLILPGLENNKLFILLTSLGFFWILSLLHCLGVRASSWISTCGSIIGTLLPMFLIMGLALYSLATGQPSATPFSWSAFIPDAHSLKNLAFFSNILFSLLGLDVIAMHAGNVKNPHKTYPRALGLSALLILFTLTFSSLSLCIIMPSEKIGLMSGLMVVFNSFFDAYHIPAAGSVIAFCIIIGGLAIASSWMVGLARGLHVALGSINVPSWIQYTNKNNMPSRVLFFQAIVYSLLLGIYLLFPNINSSYWVLSALAAQFALLYYIVLFCAAVKLLRQQKQNRLDNLLSVALPCMALAICLCGIVVGFLPPEQIPFGSTLRYELLMLSFFVSIGFVPVLILKRWRKQNATTPMQSNAPISIEMQNSS